MNAQFLAKESFVIESRCIFVIHGEILAGTIRAGQRALSRGFDARVDAVESVLLSAATGQAAAALCFRFLDQSQLAQWQGLDLHEAIFDLTE